MKKLSLSLQNNSPLLLTGADGATPELRAASLRGSLRFWLRSLLGAQIGPDVKMLSQLESAIMGSTGSASPLTFRWVTQAKELDTANVRVLPHSQQKRFRQSAIGEDQDLQLEVGLRLGQPDFPPLAIPSLLLLLNLGGLGKRSRRGFGSLQVRGYQPSNFQPDEPTTFMLKFRPENGQQLTQYMDMLVRWSEKVTVESNQALASARPYTLDTLPEYPVLSKAHAKVLVCQAPFINVDYLDPMLDFWETLRSNQFRDDRAYGHAGRGERRASPLFMHLHQTTAGYHLVLTAFRAKPAPTGSKGWKLINDFMDACKEEHQGVYVLGGDVKW